MNRTLKLEAEKRREWLMPEVLRLYEKGVPKYLVREFL